LHFPHSQQLSNIGGRARMTIRRRKRLFGRKRLSHQHVAMTLELEARDLIFGVFPIDVRGRVRLPAIQQQRASPSGQFHMNDR
jgi:hypothetical protein